MAVIETQSNGILTGNHYENMLKESIDRFLEEFQKKKDTDFSGFTSIFFRFLQSRLIPPLETIWFYSSVKFLSNKSDDDLVRRVLEIRDLFQLLSASSAPCNGVKSIAVLAPVLFKLYHLVSELTKKGERVGVREKKAMKEIEGLVNGIVGYISICGCNGGNDDGGDDLSVSCFGDLVKVWTIKGGKKGRDEVLREFLPLVSDEIRVGFGDEEGIKVDYLAGVVIVEAFLLSLCLKCRAAGNGVSKVELEKELKAWVVGSITGFRNCYFFGILLRMLLEPALPVISLLGSEDEALLRKILFDAVILVDYSFLNSDRETGASADYMKNLAITKLIVIHEATQAARSNKNQTKAISYINAFSRSPLPSQLVKWASNQIGIEQNANKLNNTTPETLINWLLKIEQKGVQVFDLRMSKLRAKLVLDMSKMKYEESTFKSNSKVADEDLFFIDTKGGAEEVRDEDDQEMVDSVDAAFVAAARQIKASNEKTRKRKEGERTNAGAKVKFQKYDLDNNISVEKMSASSDSDDGKSGSEVDDPLSEDMEE
ncbi:hypothetical protein MKW98_001011 [Papaver atlanticum]|uniref:Uncharacterized protein n=1 Tax=Papaver atlanticum TaxID=357466 RepID=A0AAD4XCQ6_9MAGN|nr:hypothetical protein MKW98_001011 [Papaver atlanticum]